MSGTAERKLVALEELVVQFYGAKHDADKLQDTARVITDLISPEMSDDEIAATWLLIRYSKRREAELRATEEGVRNRIAVGDAR